MTSFALFFLLSVGSVMSVSAATPAQNASASLDANPASEYLKLRDPFRIPEVALLASRQRSELEQFAVGDMRLSAVVTGPLRMKAMIALPNGKNVFVQERDKIGIRNGVVHRITPEAILVREQIVNVLGQEEGVLSEIRISSNKTQGSTGSQP